MNPSDWTDAVEALRNGQVIVDPLISHQFEQQQLTDGLDIMMKHNEPFCKVMTVWNN